MDGKMSLSQKRREEGKCCYCGGERDGEYKMCSECRAYHRSWYRVMRDRQTKKQRFQFNVKKALYMNARNKRLRAQGLCIRCKQPSPEHWLCDACRAKRREQDGFGRVNDENA